MGRTLSASRLLEKQYKTYELNEEWRNAIGNPETNFRQLIWGASGSGKTTFALKLCKYLSTFGKCYYNSIEQGEGKSLQDVARHVNLAECKPGSFMIGDRDTFEEMVDKLKKNRAKFCVIDSSQYMNLTTAQYKMLIKLFKTKSFIIISWEGAGEQPKGEHAKAIRYMVDIKTYVKNGVARSASRFGATTPYKIFDHKAEKQQLQLSIFQN